MGAHLDPRHTGPIKILVAWLTAWLAGTVAFALYGLLLSTDHHAAAVWSTVQESILAVFLWTLIVGVPTHFILRRASWTKWYIYTSSGFVLGFLSISLLMSFSFYGLPTSIDEFSRKLPMVPGMFLDVAPILGPMGGLSGAITSFIFWVIARPDNGSV